MTERDLLRTDFSDYDESACMCVLDGIRRAMDAKRKTVDSEDILWGILQNAGDEISSFLNSAGVDYSSVRQKLEATVAINGSRLSRLVRRLTMKMEFSEHSQQALAAARKISQAHGDYRVSSVHLLSGILNVPEGAAFRILLETHADPLAIQDALAVPLTHVCKDRSLELPFLLKRAGDAARATRSLRIQEEHVFIAVLDFGTSQLVSELTALGIDLAELRLELLEEAKFSAGAGWTKFFGSASARLGIAPFIADKHTFRILGFDAKPIRGPERRFFNLDQVAIALLSAPSRTAARLQRMGVDVDRVKTNIERLLA